MKTHLTLCLCLLSTWLYAGDIKVMIFSDPHVLHHSLFDEQTDFSNGLLLSEYTQDLFDAQIQMVKDSMPDVLLIPGDLSNNGDSVSHAYVADRLHELTSLNIRVCIIPGNHDINEPGACSYTDVHTRSINVAEFRSLYHDFGYADAEYIAPDSVSYMIYLSDDMALICMNSALDNSDGHKSAGGLTEEVLSWAESMANIAQSEGHYPFGMMHHQVVAHFDNQLMLDNDHVANCDAILSSPSLPQVQGRLVNAGITTVFTGHAHIHSCKDVVPADSTGNLLHRTLYDISTNATSSYGAALRTLHINEGQISQMSSTIVPNIAALTTIERDSIALIRTSNLANSVFNRVITIMADMLGSASIASTLGQYMRPLIDQYMLADYSQLFCYLSQGDEMDGGLAASRAFAAQCEQDFTQVKSSLTGNFLLKLALNAIGKWNSFLEKLSWGEGLLNGTVYSIMLNYTGFDEMDAFSDANQALFNRLHDTHPVIPRQYTLTAPSTGIHHTEAPANGEVYSIHGIYMGQKERLTELPQGVYIIDGQKVIR